ncbi:hypothetical protein RGE_28270 [Rubrivivax gelatinosus IL144]|uniref:Uncharacterized protein n=1 Tax=Rubrivivax gelatinosus (strain NBRC 100245 / IL144) TaxID=983917 RepID=I0HT29_RUBGI|nr:hypothetical protein RGE_28270 [Rubrivivax gelatinosus IL144]
MASLQRRCSALAQDLSRGYNAPFPGNAGVGGFFQPIFFARTPFRGCRRACRGLSKPEQTSASRPPAQEGGSKTPRRPRGVTPASGNR